MIIVASLSRIYSGQAILTYGTGQVPEGSGQVMTFEKQIINT